ncbi:MAG: DUF4832 domain-containing protein, partial [Balneolales bacterium]
MQPIDTRLFSGIFLVTMCCLLLWQCNDYDSAEMVKVHFSPSNEIFNNPDRGFYRYTGGGPGSEPLDANALREIYDDGFTLIGWRNYMEEFRESDLTEAYLNQLEADFQAMRDAGVKAVIRFSYSRRIGDPDASLERVHRHMDQLRPVLERNYDVIAFTEAGFIGAWGEWHASTHDLTSAENMMAVLEKYMDVLPERFVLVRYPQSKMAAFSSLEPISDENAFDGSYKSRTGHHNDCFLASLTDVGTYSEGRFDYSFFDGVRDTLDTEWVKNYVSRETRYVPIGGETCNPRPEAGDRFHCPTALEEMEWLRYTYLNWNYSRQTLDTWEEQGCMPEVQRRMGYRLALLNGSFSQTTVPGGTFRFQLEIRNEGFAPPYNPRNLQVVLRNVNQPDRIVKVDLPDDPRYWLGGETIRLQHELGIPDDIPDGEYEVLLNLPDPNESIRN